MTHEEPEGALTPAEALALAGREQSRMDATYLAPVAAILVSWGVAWGAGFALLWVEATTDLIEPVVAWTIYTVLIIAAVVISAVLGARMGRGIRGGDDGFVGALYGVSWFAGSVAVAAVGAALQMAGADADIMAVYYPAGYALVVGVLYLAGAAMFRAVAMIPLGAWILVSGVAASFFGAPVNYLVMSIAGGGGFLVGALAIVVVARARIRRDPTRTVRGARRG